MFGCDNPLEQDVTDLENRITQLEDELAVADSLNAVMMDSLVTALLTQNLLIDSLYISQDSYIDSLNTDQQAYIDSLNADMQTYIDSLNTDMQAYIDLLDTTQDTYIDSLNTDMQAYIDSQQAYIDSLNTAQQDYIDLLNTDQEAYIDSLYNEQQAMLESLEALAITTGFTPIEVYNGTPDNYAINSDCATISTALPGCYTYNSNSSYDDLIWTSADISNIVQDESAFILVRAHYNTNPPDPDHAAVYLKDGEEGKVSLGMNPQTSTFDSPLGMVLIEPNSPLEFVVYATQYDGDTPPSVSISIVFYLTQ